MSADENPDPPKTDDLLRDPGALKGAHERSGRLFQQAGLPFEEEEFDENLPRESDADSSTGSAGDASAPDTDEGSSSDSDSDD